jgi:AraC-like DNA-binding protein
VMRQKRIPFITKEEHLRLEQIKQMIEEHPGERHTLNQIAAAFHINRSKLIYGFKKKFRYSLHQFVIKTRMNNARNMLVKTEIPIKAIATLNGYSNTENFTNAFKKYSGYTPTDLRNRKKKK